VTVLKAESIINDGTALVLFGVAVSVAVGGHPVSPAALTAGFIGSYVGGISAGLLVGLAVTQIRRRIDAPQEEGALSLLTPFAAFLLAETIHSSGVVAVLVCALVLAYATPHVTRARSRLQTFAFWDLTTFLINGSLWVFVGTQMPHASPASTAGLATRRYWLLPSPASSSSVGLPATKPSPSFFARWTDARCSAPVVSVGANASYPTGRDFVARCRWPQL
jgi:NhaP-type Na+/H+ or K+/H+ antiporter